MPAECHQYVSDALGSAATFYLVLYLEKTVDQRSRAQHNFKLVL